MLLGDGLPSDPSTTLVVIALAIAAGLMALYDRYRSTRRADNQQVVDQLNLLLTNERNLSKEYRDLLDKERVETIKQVDLVDRARYELSQVKDMLTVALSDKMKLEAEIARLKEKPKGA